MTREIDIADVPVVPLTGVVGPALQLPATGRGPTVLVPGDQNSVCIMLDDGSLLTIENEVEWWMGRVVSDVKIEIDRQTGFKPSWFRRPMLAILEHEDGLSIMVRRGSRRSLYPWQGTLPPNYQAATGFLSWRVYVERRGEQIFLYAHVGNAWPRAFLQALPLILSVSVWLIVGLAVARALSRIWH